MRKMMCLLCAMMIVFLVSCSKNLESFGSIDKTMPSDFSFALSWGNYGISSYDSATGELIKTTDTTHPEDYITKYELPAENKERIYELIQELDMDSYPDVYNPHEDGLMSEPSLTLILTVRMGNETKTILAEDIAYTYESNNKKGQQFLTTCAEISNMLSETEEWKALPDYEFYYE